MTQEIVRYDTSHGPVELTVATIKDLFCRNATDAEAQMFLKVCQYQGLNPFLREAYLVKYSATAPASIVVGKDAFTKRASQRPEFDGYKAGIVVQRGEQVIEVEGSLLLPGDVLVGGWAEVHRKDMAHPFRDSVSMTEYNAQQSSWNKMPATMIRKVALVHVLREAFPDTFQALYDEAEMAQAFNPSPPAPPTGPRVLAQGVPASTQEPANGQPEPVACPVHQDSQFEQRKGPRGRFWSHRDGDDWCNASAKPVLEAWQQTLSEGFEALGITEQEDKRAWLTDRLLGLPATASAWQANHYGAAVYLVRLAVSQQHTEDDNPVTKADLWGPEEKE